MNPVAVVVAVTGQSPMDLTLNIKSLYTDSTVCKICWCWLIHFLEGSSSLDSGVVLYLKMSVTSSVKTQLSGSKGGVVLIFFLNFMNCLGGGENTCLSEFFSRIST